MLGTATVAAQATLYSNPGTYPGGYPFPPGATEQLLFGGPTLAAYYYNAVGIKVLPPAAPTPLPAACCTHAATSVGRALAERQRDWHRDAVCSPRQQRRTGEGRCHEQHAKASGCMQGRCGLHHTSGMCVRVACCAD